MVISFLYIKLGIQPFTYRTIKIFLLITLSFLINYLLPTLDSWILDSLYRSLILFVIYVGFTYFYRLSEELNSIVLKALSMIGLARKNRK